MTEHIELLNDIDKEHPALIAFARYQSIKTLIREILIEYPGNAEQGGSGKYRGYMLYVSLLYRK